MGGGRNWAKCSMLRFIQSFDPRDYDHRQNPNVFCFLNRTQKLKSSMLQAFKLCLKKSQTFPICFTIWVWKSGSEANSTNKPGNAPVFRCGILSGSKDALNDAFHIFSILHECRKPDPRSGGQKSLPKPALSPRLQHILRTF
jgi:hypothetical protein